MRQLTCLTIIPSLPQSIRRGVYQKPFILSREETHLCDTAALTTSTSHTKAKHSDQITAQYSGGNVRLTKFSSNKHNTSIRQANTEGFLQWSYAGRILKVQNVKCQYSYFFSSLSLNENPEFDLFLLYHHFNEQVQNVDSTVSFIVCSQTVQQL